MRSTSSPVDGFQVFAVAGTNSVSFGIEASAAARAGLLGFAVQRATLPNGKPKYLLGYKVFPSTGAKLSATGSVSTKSQPVQSLVWDDSGCQPGKSYLYSFEPLRGTPAALDRTAAPVTITVTTEPLYGQSHDVFFNRGIVASQEYALEFGNLSPDAQPTPAKKKAAYKWLARDLLPAMIKFIRLAKKNDQLRCAFYEFDYPEVLAEFAAALAHGVDLKLVIDEKQNAAKDPLTENLTAIAAAGLPATAIIPRTARVNAIAHNKFMVLIPHGGAPTQVWTGSTNLTPGGIFGQANVGHWVRDATVANTYLDYWTLLSTNPGGLASDSSAVVRQKNAALYAAVGSMTPTPALGSIGEGVTPLFSPRSGLDPMNLYRDLIAKASHLSCATFPFTIAASFSAALQQNGPTGPLVFLLLDTAAASKIRLTAANNVYEAAGSEIGTPLGRWSKETDSGHLGLNEHVDFIHCKFLLHDPLGPDPVVVTGSANFSDASTNDNDENMIIVRGDTRVADIYFTEFNRLFNHYYFRYVSELTAGEPTPNGSLALEETDAWLGGYATATQLRSKRVQQFIDMWIPTTNAP
ncbi:MAG TPA: phospholipase D-like domain-containing protein [Galbitalea sp.]|jgi:phosphatidylserine/phosphatidylglycerophosphate/cardiolipin synthase-like enzyme|nr:phospholipase D-like domain-containing protein [Galbitalea sp.]